MLAKTLIKVTHFSGLCIGEEKTCCNSFIIILTGWLKKKKKIVV
jgi:hypothetical protein